MYTCIVFFVAIERIEAVRGNKILLKNSKKLIPIGVTYRKDVLEKLGIS